METGKKAQCGCGKPALPGTPEQEDAASFVTGTIQVNGRTIPRVATRLSFQDRLGSLRVRLGMGRSRYRVRPGLYAVGAPGPGAPVMVTANYKLSFDALRRELGGIDAWILVLDTRGVNVWCAAGKGTFGTRELIERVGSVRLDEVAFRPRLILPQLGAPGVSAPEVSKATGLRVIWGPVRASDIPAFLAREMKKDEAMRTVEFRVRDRMAVAPVEVVQALPAAAVLVVVSALLALPPDGEYIRRALTAFIPLVGSVLVGGLLFPLLLPWLPFRAFSLKGAVLGIIWGAAASAAVGAGLLGGAAMTLMCAPIVSYIAMNYTGSSTYTCLTGAETEVKRGLPPMAASALAGIGLFVVRRFAGA
jgi:hypothetical protein